MKWFRWYRGTSENPKFSLVARRANNPGPCGDGDRVDGAVSLTDVLAVWCVILEDAGNPRHWGTCEKDAEFIAAVLQWGETEVGSVIREMTKIGLLEQRETGLHVEKWDEYQYTSDTDPTNAERQRRYYNKHKTDTKRQPNADKRQPNALAKRPDTDTDTDTEKKKDTRVVALSPDFDSFWNIWPNKVGKPAAMKAFVSARKRADLDSIVDGVFAYIRDKPPDRPWLNPATFLNQNRWEDQPAKVEHGTTKANSLTASIRRELAELEQSESTNLALPVGRLLRISG